MKIVIIIAFTVIFGGCDLFSTRPAEPPNLPRSNFQQAVTPQILIENLVNSFKDKNVEDYLACLSDSSFTKKKFVFVPSSSSISQFPSSWGTKSEELYFNNVMAKVSGNTQIILTLSNENYSPQGDSVIYTASYSLNVPTIDPNMPTLYEGSLRFYITTDSRSIYSIDFWQDYSLNNQLPTWSELKWRNY